MRRLAATLCLAALPAMAQDGAAPFPVDLGGEFRLVSSAGGVRGAADPEGWHQLLFFGYASCAQICSAALPTMAGVAEAMAARGARLRPVMITVDPETDTPGAMGAALARHHPDFVGLTGDAAALQAAYDAFAVERELLFTDATGADIYAHGSFLYLLSPGGEVRAVLPPVLSIEAIAAIVARHLGAS